ncbi:MAG: hypothetical protein ABL953_14360 [Ilumatobacteraceae bacterium]
MSTLPPPKVRTEKLIELAEKVARQPLPLQTRILLPTILLVVGVAAFWLGLRDREEDPAPSPSPTTTISSVVETSIVITSPP